MKQGESGGRDGALQATADGTCATTLQITGGPGIAIITRVERPMSTLDP
jgi:hypothetical protein